MRPDSAETVYEGVQIDVTREQWGERERDVVEHPGAVAVVAVDRDGFVTLVRQTREAAQKALLELPAGTLEPDEEPLATAQRELAEETGLRGGSWRKLAAFYTTPGISRERMHVFLAEGVERGSADPEEGEDVTPVRWPVDEVGSRLGDIEDGKTLVGLLLYLRAASGSD